MTLKEWVLSNKKIVLIGFLLLFAFSAITGVVVFIIEDLKQPIKEPIAERSMVSQTPSPKLFSSPMPKQEFLFEEAYVDEESVNQTLEGVKDITEVEVNNDLGMEALPDDKVVHVYIKPTDLWNEKETVKLAAGKAAFIMSKLFVNEKVSQVGVWLKADFTDQYGKTEERTAVRITMSRDTAEKVADWKAIMLKIEMEGYEAMQAIADQFYIYPPVLQKL